MNTGKESNSTAVAPATYSFGENPEHAMTSQAMALVALSHTTVEHQLYSVMLAEIATVGTRVASFTTRRLMSLTGINAYSSVRRGLIGLANKLSIERQKVAGRRRLCVEVLVSRCPLFQGFQTFRSRVRLPKDAETKQRE